MRRPETIRAIPEPAKRARAAMAETVAAQGVVNEYAAITRDAVREMRRTMSHAQIGKLLGVTRGRVQQIERGPVGRHVAPADPDTAQPKH